MESLQNNYNILLMELQKLKSTLEKAESMPDLESRMGEHFTLRRQWLSNQTDVVLPEYMKMVSLDELTRIHNLQRTVKQEQASLRQYKSELDEIPPSDTKEREKIERLIVSRCDDSTKKVTKAESECYLLEKIVCRDIVHAPYQELTAAVAAASDTLKSIKHDCNDLETVVASLSHNNVSAELSHESQVLANRFQSTKTQLRDRGSASMNSAVRNFSNGRRANRHVIQQQIFVKNFAQSCTEDTFKSLFAKFGVELISIKHSVNGCFAFITLSSKQNALEAALCWNGCSIDSSGRRLQVLPQDNQLRHLLGSSPIYFPFSSYSK